MIDGLKLYPLMKDSGVPWLGEVPEHWGIARSKRLFRQRKEFARPDDEQLSATQAYGVIPQAIYETRTGYRVVKISLHLEKRRHVEADDFVISMRSFEGGLERAWSPGAIRSSYVVLRPLHDAQPDFFQYLFKSAPYITALRGTADFIRDGQDLNFDNFCSVVLPLIPAKEQAAIVRFLDHADRKIRRYIRAKQKLIKLLEEQKQAIIHRAVTRGLDPNVRLKPSGVDWLGDVPVHWDVVPLKRAFSRMDYGISQSGSDSGVIPLLTMGHIRNGVVTVPERGGVGRVEKSLLLKDKDLLFNRTNSAELVAKVGLFCAVGRPVTFASYLVRMRSHADNSPEFLNFALNAPAFLGAARREAIPSLHQSNLNPTRYGRLPIPLPPSQEQLQIVDVVLEQTSCLNDTAASAWREIDLLHEYRTRLIADVVTGKLDVREAAAQLPDEDQDLPPIVGSDEISDAEEDGFDDLDEGTEDPEP